MKIIFFFSFLLFLSLQTNAQFKLGIKAGYNNAWAEYPNQPNVIKQSISAIQFGVVGEFALRKVLLKSNILFNQKGNYIDDTRVLIDDNRWVTYRLNYIEANILAGYKFKLNSNLGLSIAAGPYVGIGVSGTEKGEGSSLFLGNYNVDRKAKFTNVKVLSDRNVNFNPIDLGIDINASVNYKKFFWYCNFSKGLIDRTSSTSEEWKSRNNVFSVGAGYYFK
jgi:hypothetical protein